MQRHVSLIYGDGIGPEVVEAAVRVVEKAGVPIMWEEVPMGQAALETYGCALPEVAIESIKKNGIALKGPTTTPIATGHVSANVMLRKALDLYACIRPVRTRPGVVSRYENVDLVVFRENTEGLYCGQEFAVGDQAVVSLRVMTEKACTRIVERAFQFAKTQRRRKVCMVHKANILKKGDGLWLACARRVRENYPEIAYEEAIMDALCMRLVMSPESLDVLVLENMFGDIVSDLAAGLVGGLGVVAGANVSDNCAVFEAVHGSAPDIAGRGIANPTAMIACAILMLEHMGETASVRIAQALDRVLGEKSLQTKDLGGKASTADFVGALLSEI